MMRTRVWAWIVVVGMASAASAAPGAPGEATPPSAASAEPGWSGGASPRAAEVGVLSPQELAGVAALARAVALIRYLHPSDQAAALDWNAFLPGAVDRVRRARDPAALLAELRAVFARIAPTAVFSTVDSPPATVSPPRGAGTRLARWRRYGPGSPSPYPSFREGRDDEREVAVSEVIAVPLAEPGRCGVARVNAVIRRRSAGTVDVMLIARRAGQDESQIPWPVTQDGRVVFSAQVSPDTQALELGLRVDGRSGATLESLTLSCSGGARLAIDPAAAAWRTAGPTDLYTWQVDHCAAGPCATLARRPLDHAFVPERDLISADLGSDIRLDLPLAVWADARRTLPVVPDPPAPATATSQRTIGLAAVAAAWGTLAMFYPYFADQHIDWQAALGPALQEASDARDAAELRVALRHLLAELHDGHARLIDPTASSGGILPIALRRFGDRIVVTGGVDRVPGITLGSELVALDDVPALALYDRVAAQVSAAGDGLRAHLAASALGAGPPGTVRQARLRAADGTSIVRGLPLVARERAEHVVRPSRPWTGTELVPGVLYVDFDELAPETWTALLPTLTRARALIFDFRGYSTTGLVAISHVLDHAVEQLTWQVPELPARDRAAFTPVPRMLYPRAPHLTAPIIALVDGQSASTVETTLALIRDYHLGMLIGEPSAGTSGLVTHAAVPGGYLIRFTAIRLAEPDGSILHGKGIRPDLVVHPALAAVRAGRDEILVAGVAAAERLAGLPPAPAASPHRP